jgi:peptide-methionine (S)-S-oxide reductase
MVTAVDSKQGDDIQSITLAGGCFWCVEAVFEHVDGVLSVESGYSNGQAPNPSYEAVCSGRTGHAEVVRVRFDSRRISLKDVLEIFFAVHDPTTLNRQGNDVGTQYRSAIYVESAGQEAVARAVMADAQSSWGSPIVTELAPLANYHRAEDYHQHYFAQHPGQGYCMAIIAPKLSQFRKTFARHLKSA